MNHEQVILSWKNHNYRCNLKLKDIRLLPPHPAGLPLTDAELDTVVGQMAFSFFGCSSIDRSYQSTFYDPGTVFIDNGSFSNDFPVENFYGD